MLIALEGLFVKGLEQGRPTRIPLCGPKNAPMADITYHSEEGALVDFEIEELVELCSRMRRLGRRPHKLQNERGV